MTASPLGPRTKGLRLAGVVDADVLTSGRPEITGPQFSWPMLTLDEGAVEHNLDLMARLCADAGVEHAPHVKTAMSAQLFARQQARGVWGATVANAAQLRTVRDWGAERVFLANELYDPREIAWIRAELERAVVAGALGAGVGGARAGGTQAGGTRSDGTEIWLYVDSAAGLELLVRAFADAPAAVRSRLGVLVELGVAGGRTGVRGVGAAVDLARAVVEAGLRLVGVAGYEGSAASGTTPTDLALVAAYCQDLRSVAAGICAAELIPTGQPVVVSAGGSSFLDVVLAELPGDVRVAALPGDAVGNLVGDAVRDVVGDPTTWPVRVVVRSGAYVTHDHGFCARMDPWTRIPGAEPMRAAATVWGQVLSAPEPGLVICGVGRRDVSYDIDLPVALTVRRALADGTSGPVTDLTGAQVTALNDQHLYLTVTADAGLVPGDVVGFGVSHPCTLFDKWRVAAMVDDAGRVVEIVTTDF